MRYILLLLTSLLDLPVFSQYEYQMGFPIFDSLDPVKKEVTEFYIEKGSRGCFHSDKAKRSYIKIQNKFVLDAKTSNSDFLTGAPQYIDKEKIHELLYTIDSSRFLPASIRDLKLTQEDITNFKKFIDSEEQRIKENEDESFDEANLYSFPKKDVDFAFYKKIADSLETLPVRLVDEAFWSASEILCTTTSWRVITFVFRDKTKLIIKNSDYCPNYLYVPWTVNYEGVEFKSNSIVFGKKLHQLVGSDFFDRTDTNNFAIFKIADYLYRARLKSK